MRRALGPALAAVATAFVWLVPFKMLSLWRGMAITDLPTYQHIVNAIADGQMPYRDIPIEYPPLATALFWVVARLPGHYDTAFDALMMLCLCATAAGVVATAQALGVGRNRAVAAAVPVVLCPLLLGNLVSTRFDLSLAAVLAWTVWAAVTARWRWMWALLVVGVLLKLVPLALVPVLMVWHAHRVDVRAALRGAGTWLGIGALLVFPLVTMTPGGMWHVLDYHLSRPPQIESLASSYTLALHLIAGFGVAVESSFGSQGLSGDGPATVAALTTAGTVVLVGAIAVATHLALRRARTGLDARVTVAGVAATVAALVATGKVLSPQFMVWLLPATFLVCGRYGPGAWVAGVAAMVLTQTYFPDRYWDLVALHHGPILLLCARNAVLMMLVALCWPRGRQGMPPPSGPVMSRGPGAPEVTGPDHAVRARYLTD
ncbi:MAG: glycosyltransferase 87 family protein [Thermoleophilia bacterium]